MSRPSPMATARSARRYPKATQAGRGNRAARETRLRAVSPAAPSGADGKAEERSTTGVDVDVDDVLPLRTIRDPAKAQMSPFVIDNNGGVGFVGENDRVMLNALHYGSPDSAGATCVDGLKINDDECAMLPAWAIRSGARKTIYRDPLDVRAAIVTCGGLCPGLNDVVRQLVLSLEDYGVGLNADDPKSVINGISFGFGGFYQEGHKEPIRMTRQTVDGIQMRGGTLLGTSRGGSDVKEIVKAMKELNVNMLFVVGGNGGNAGANAIDKECAAQGYDCSVIGIPKSIDNDILLIDKCFGFDTAVQEAVHAIDAAKVEASSAKNGIGVVKLMGRQSGFIAAAASTASGEVDLCLIPEVPFEMNGAMAHIERRVRERGHAVVVVAEGAGQDILGADAETDASGNPILKDVGPFMRDEIKKHFKKIGDPADVKYIDPSYMIRAQATIPSDKIYCMSLAQGAVHAAFAGFTGLTVGLVNGHYCYLPISTVIQAANVVDIRGKKWNRVLMITKQPAWGTLESADPVSSMYLDDD